MKNATGYKKFKRDKAILNFSLKHRQWTHREIAEKFGLERSTVSRILMAQSHLLIKEIEGKGK